MGSCSKIIYTITDEAPALATKSLYPIIDSIINKAHIKLEKKDISLAARILSQFPDYLLEEEIIKDELAELGELVLSPEANIIKLPNISASVLQIKDCIKELKENGFNLPNYPDLINNEKDKEIKSRYDRIKGSAVNPILREGNSDRRCAASVKSFAKDNPHNLGLWSSESRSRVSSMKEGDFFGNEKSITLNSDEIAHIVLKTEKGESIILKEGLKLASKDILDATFMDLTKLKVFLKDQIDVSKNSDILFSLHLKATMMKVSDPIIFGHAVSVFFDKVFQNNKDIFNSLGANAKNGFTDILNSLEKISDSQIRDSINKDIKDCYDQGPKLAMVDSDKGITNLHVPSDVIIDASMPASIKSSGKMWGPDGKLKDTNFVIPDRCYSDVYDQTIKFCKKNGAFNPEKMGSVSNIGLMAQKAEEYGSHDKTFEIPSNGIIQIITKDSKVLLEHKVKKGDIWRACVVKNKAIIDWVNLAIRRAKETNTPIIFWLNKDRAHDKELINKIKASIASLDLEGIDLQILSPKDATIYTLDRLQNGLDTISVTGNVLRDYLTDLFPILELGTSAKMLSIVPLMNGGGLFETGAGGSAPKHVQQLVLENHLRWDSLGEFLALGVSLEHLSKVENNKKAKVLSITCDKAIEKLLNRNCSPSRKVGELDNRGSHFYFAMYWAEALALQKESSKLSTEFSELFNDLKLAENEIINEFKLIQGSSVNLNGYYNLDNSEVEKIMRPSRRFNNIINSF